MISFCINYKETKKELKVNHGSGKETVQLVIVDDSGIRNDFILNTQELQALTGFLNNCCDNIDEIKLDKESARLDGEDDGGIEED